MNGFLNFFTGTLNTVAWLYIFLPCAVLGGLYLTIRSGAVQFKHFGYAMRNTAGRMFQKQEAGVGAVTPFQAVTTALSATIGTGNIVGTSQAIALGGYGALFWLWIAALVGMCTKYCEVVLSIKYRERNEKGEWVGGPMYYIRKGMGKSWAWLAGLYAALAGLAAFGIGNLSQANSIVGAVGDAVVSFKPAAADNLYNIKLFVGIAMAFALSLILFGGVKRIGQVSEKLVPFMAIFYILFALIVIGVNANQIIPGFAKVFQTCFTPGALGGAASGILLKECVVWGLRRSAFSNEAGLGSAAIAHAAAETKGPVYQGIYGIFEVFVDTIVICTITAMTIITSGIDINFGTKPGSELISAAMGTVFGQKFASAFVAFALILFAFSTILGWALYGARCAEYLLGHKAGRIYRAFFVVVVIIGSISELSVVWDIADTLNGLMAIPNFIALFALSGIVAKETKEHFDRWEAKKAAEKAK